jgi:hypothetical protein
MVDELAQLPVRLKYSRLIIHGVRKKLRKIWAAMSSSYHIY